MGWVTLSQEILEPHGQNDLIHIFANLCTSISYTSKGFTYVNLILVNK